jgi:hypothetical protein
MQITTKRMMYELYAAGCFGNRFAAWDSLKDAQAVLPSDAHISIRSRGPSPGGPCLVDVPLSTAVERLSIYAPQGWTQWQFIEPVPRCVVFQGEVMCSEAHYDLTYSTLNLPMRPALAQAPQYAQGLRVLHLLQHYMDPASYDDIQALLTFYDGAVVEFAVFAQNVGIVPHRNTIIWEVRHY